ncbi:MAG: hypothetical protein ABJC12_08890 [Saprospiraceae bacterium]
MKIQLIVVIVLTNLALSAQTFVDIPWREGMIKKDGQEMPGMIRLGGDLGAPWLNHSKVYFVTSENYTSAKNHPGKKVIVEYSPEDIQGYSTYTEDKDKNHIDLKYTSGEVTYMDGLAKKKQVVFLQDQYQGAVMVYTYIPMAEKESTAQMQYEAGQNAINHTVTFLKKGDGPYVIAGDTELSDFLSECPDVVSKIKAGTYGFYDLSQRPKKKGLGKIMSLQAGHNELENKIAQAVIDYNQCVK